MMKKITLLLALLLVKLGFAQTLPFDFSDPIHAMTGADGAIVSVVQDNGNDVLQIVGTGGDWDNAQINFAQINFAQINCHGLRKITLLRI